MPSTLPATAPISRRRLSARTRNSKTITAQAAPGAHARTHPSCQAEWMKEITDPGKKGHKKKTNKNEIHKRSQRIRSRQNRNTSPSPLCWRAGVMNLQGSQPHTWLPLPG
jgi:hypothetical protein